MILMQLILIIVPSLVFVLITDCLYRAFFPAERAKLRTRRRYTMTAILGPYVAMASLISGVVLMGAGLSAGLITAQEFDQIAGWGSRNMIFALVGWPALAAFFECKRVQYVNSGRD